MSVFAWDWSPELPGFPPGFSLRPALLEREVSAELVEETPQEPVYPLPGQAGTPTARTGTQAGHGLGPEPTQGPKAQRCATFALL